MVKTAVVTGATGGMGVEIIKDLARDHRVYALGRRAGELPEAENIVPVEIDLLSLLDGTALPTELASLERVDVLVHAAARADKHSVESASPEDWRAQMDLNVHVPAELTRQLLPALRAAEGLAVFINSGAGVSPRSGNALYSASKAGLKSLADTLRQEEAGKVRVTSIYPGRVDTPLSLIHI